MRRTIITRQYGECCFPLTEEPPHFFCGETTAHENTSYCARHHAICHSGFGKDVHSLEEMIYGMENTVLRRRMGSARGAEAPITVAVDVAVRE